MENVADYYYEKLSSSDNPGNILAKFFEELYHFPFSVKHVIMFNKLVKVYGKYVPYFAVLDFYSYEEADPEDPFRLLAYYCKKRVEQKTSAIIINDAYKDLERMVRELSTEIEKRRESPIKAKGW